MIRVQFIPCLACVAALFLLATSSRATEATNTLSGRVFDLKGHPVAGVSLNILPTKLINGHAITVIDKFSTQVNKSDDAGHFSIANVKSGPVQLGVISPTVQSQQRYEIVSLKIGAATFYPMVPAHSKEIKFAVESGSDREDVVVTVRPLTRYQGQVVFEDGESLANTAVQLEEEWTYKHGERTISARGLDYYPMRTDANGYFVRYVDEPDFEIRYYTVTVTFQGLIATTKFRLKSGEQRRDLVFALEGAPMAIGGKIVFEDGTPLPEAWFTLDVRANTEDERRLSHVRGQRGTDNEGFFVEPLYQPGLYAPGRYTAVVEYQGLSATSETTLKAGERQDDLVFTLNGAPVFFNVFGMELMAPTVPNTIGVWIGAPNGSQYKSVRCNSWQDAQTKARADGVKLVSINDEVEQEWLVEQFGFLPYWIGLVYSNKTGEWEWSSGEPVTYTNWAMGQPDSMTAENYGIMHGADRGQWRVRLLGDENFERNTPKAAILEKKLFAPDQR